MMQETIELPSIIPIRGMAEMSRSIDEIIALATRRIVIFDRYLAEGGYNTPQRFNRLKVFRLANQRNRIDIALHKSENLERDCARMMILLRQFPHAVSVRRTLPEAQRVQDGFVVADGIHFDHRFTSIARWRSGPSMTNPVRGYCNVDLTKFGTTPSRPPLPRYSGYSPGGAKSSAKRPHECCVFANRSKIVIQYKAYLENFSRPGRIF